MHTDMKKPTGDGNPTPGSTDLSILARLSRQIKRIAFYVGGLVTTIFGGLR